MTNTQLGRSYIVLWLCYFVKTQPNPSPTENSNQLYLTDNLADSWVWLCFHEEEEQEQKEQQQEQPPPKKKTSTLRMKLKFGMWA